MPTGSASESPHLAPAGFRHDAFVYTDDDDFVRQAVTYVHDGLAAGETVVAVLPEVRNSLLRKELDGVADQVVFLDMTQLGRNPARIIPLWRTLLDQAPDIPLRGLGEPAYPGRTPSELAEAALHELLLDVAFEHTSPFHLRCPYSASLPIRPAEVHVSAAGPARTAAERVFRTPLAAVPAQARQREFGRDDLTEVRYEVNTAAKELGMPAGRIEDIELALHEICTNSVRFGGGQGRLSWWTADGNLVCDVADGGRIDDLLVGRVLPPADGLGGRGVWLAHQLCDLVQIRSGDTGTQVRLHTRLR
ncbi:putative anti-sigma regulatory factor, serine/threonine protein kinase [Kribbella flavida DSM 17836]|uniref:Putative anti-sigma regulatory factor, serine/threonine protein kinase n=1 Tax=Kribbella flavida (strain DSM 17836 / JCM 10339 / NBRC 14399) TaxID=479435 RepID=D2Q258_KRIFD|nr:sensor histidine kinase [Kribbella flavida]ADB34004.1 putative anti-sigma regulatory factor, serine/threonine protein kinase [Kribbella flavida DSM 17836]